MNFKKGVNKKGQVTIFIILAIVLIVGVGFFFALRDSIGTKTAVSKNIEPMYASFLDCLKEETSVGISVLSSQGGRINLPEFEAGSTYAPFSNMLDFMGNPIPYWYHVSGNGKVIESVPLKTDMEKELSGFIESKISKCGFEKYYNQGFEIYMGEARVDVEIKDKSVDVNLDMGLAITFNEETAVVNTHSVSVDSHLGTLYDSAKKVYDNEQKNMFLEKYAIDVMRLYAPVDGVELECAPKVWNAENVFDEIKDAIEMNTLALRGDNNDYTIKDKNNKYFVQDLGVDYNVRFLNSRNWSNSYEVTPTDGAAMIAKPVGNQPGLGIIGFCYIPYHFVYNIKYPVLAQIYFEDEIFQFPMAVVIEGNKEREALDVPMLTTNNNELCKYKNTEMEVLVYNNRLNLVDADISYECTGASCEIGKADDISGMIDSFPQCSNGIVRASAEGYVEGRKIASTIESSTIEIILNKLHKMDIDLTLGGREYSGDAVISFNSDDYSTTVLYPENKEVELAEGQYNINVYIYKNSSLRIPATSKEQCVDSPQTGLGGLFGLTEKKCFDINMPEQIVSSALAGGGQESYYMLDSQLDGSAVVKIGAKSLPTPVTLEQLQDNYQLFEENGLEVEFE